jgi:hypothetical protein
MMSLSTPLGTPTPTTGGYGVQRVGADVIDGVPQDGRHQMPTTRIRVGGVDHS